MFLSFIDNLLPQIVFLPFPSLELRDWMKSLRLHKYTDRLLGLTYDDLLTLTDRYSLSTLTFLRTGKYKFSLCFSFQRPSKTCFYRWGQGQVPEATFANEREASKNQGAAAELGGDVCISRNDTHNLTDLLCPPQDINELRDLLRILPEMEKIILMPMKPTQQQQQRHQPSTLPSSSLSSKLPLTTDVSSCSAAAILSREERRHDSGSDSGTELAEEAGGGSAGAGGQQPPHQQGSLNDSSKEDKVSQEIFELLEKTFSIIICRQRDDRDRDRVVQHFYRLVERRCLRRDAFTPEQKLWFQTWLKRMDQVWDISNVVAAAELEAKRKYAQAHGADFAAGLRRSSLQSPSPRAVTPICSFPRGLSPVGFKNMGGSAMVPQTPALTCTLAPSAATATSGMAMAAAAAASAAAAAAAAAASVPNPAGLLALPTGDRPSEGGAQSQRRSVPDLNPPIFPGQLKRNSYQGDHRMVRTKNSLLAILAKHSTISSLTASFGRLRSP